ncbi:hypothetical protein HNY73_000959 [Argiope bruennichi]|uniref:CCHC-type domain-containing protein n=1 Tax=Argiope bruennichi TaxID=94029 RepID=A0A8T0G5U2_ARGBR|nr:hypothetical protein HNY73_000959 [Argiope bruennichi]
MSRKIASETNILVLDSFINKAVDHLDAETQKRRKELLASREKAKAAKQKKKNKRTRGRGRRIRSDSSEAEEVRQLHGESSNSIGVQIRFSGNSSPSIQVIREDDIVGRIRSDISDLSDISDISIDGLGFFGENGRCYNCGRRGHWANGCPF